MNKKINLLFLLLLLSLAALSCSPSVATKTAPSPTVPVTVELTSTVTSGLPQSEADVPRVSVADAAAAIQSGKAIVVDVRSAQAYQQSHIPGAVSIPLFDIEQNPGGVNLDKDKWIITYCT